MTGVPLTLIPGPNEPPWKLVDRERAKLLPASASSVAEIATAPLGPPPTAVPALFAYFLSAPILFLT